jgi:hypothetical protein
VFFHLCFSVNLISHMDDPSWNEEYLSTDKNFNIKKYSTTDVLTGVKATKNSIIKSFSPNTYFFDLTGGDELSVFSNPRIKSTPKNTGSTGTITIKKNANSRSRFGSRIKLCTSKKKTIGKRS